LQLAPNVEYARLRPGESLDGQAPAERGAPLGSHGARLRGIRQLEIHVSVAQKLALSA
jgi:hypothetical protein